MTKIKFIKFGANSAFGGFAPGDTLTCSESMANHLVHEAGVAEFFEPKQAPAPMPPAEVKPKKRKG